MTNADKIIFPNENDFITTENGTYRVARDYEAGDTIRVYTGGLDLAMVTGEKDIKASEVLTINKGVLFNHPIVFNGIQFETL